MRRADIFDGADGSGPSFNRVLTERNVLKRILLDVILSFRPTCRPLCLVCVVVGNSLWSRNNDPAIPVILARSFFNLPLEYHGFRMKCAH